MSKTFYPFINAYILNLILSTDRQIDTTPYYLSDRSW